MIPVHRHAKRLMMAIGLLAIIGGVTASAVSAGSRSHVLAANCGTVGFLSYKPRYWSAGCTAGSPEVAPAKWTLWTRRNARAVGKAGVQNCVPSCAEPSLRARYRSKVKLYRPKHCASGLNRLYFSRARYAVHYPSGNPFGKAPGWHDDRLRIYNGDCRLADR